MPQLNLLAIIVAAVASFAASAGWYMLLGNAMARLQPNVAVLRRRSGRRRLRRS
jgi:hypothetical protein